MERQSAVEWLLSQLQENGMVGAFCTENQYKERLKIYKKIVNEAKKIEIEQQERLIDITLNAFAMRDNLETNKRNG